MFFIVLVKEKASDSPNLHHLQQCYSNQIQALEGHEDVCKIVTAPSPKDLTITHKLPPHE